MKKLTVFEKDALMSALREHRHDWDYTQFRAYREQLDVTRETVIPAQYAIALLAYRKAEYNPADFGKDGKFAEVRERIELAIRYNRRIRWVDYSAHKPGRRDLSYGRKSGEKKTGQGNWLTSTTNCDPEAIIREFARKNTLFHLERLDLGIDIYCKWSDLFEYMSHYRRTANGPEMGLKYWFKKTVNESADGDRFTLQIQNWTCSGKKVRYLRRCPYNSADWQAIEAREDEDKWA